MLVAGALVIPTLIFKSPFAREKDRADKTSTTKTSLVVAGNKTSANLLEALPQQKPEHARRIRNKPEEKAPEPTAPPITGSLSRESEQAKKLEKAGWFAAFVVVLSAAVAFLRLRKGKPSSA